MARQGEQFATNLWAPRYWLTWLVVGVFRLAILLPYAWQLAMGRGIGSLAFRLFKRQRCIAATNLQLCFPAMDATERERRVRECFASVGMMFFEMPLAWWGSEKKLRDLVQVEGLEHLQRSLDDGRGVILFTAHFATLEISARLANLQRPISVSYRVDRNPVFNRLAFLGRSRHYQEVTSRDDVRALIRGLRSGGVLWFAPDENFPRDNRVIADFMGVPAATNPATARFARLGGAQVVPYAALRKTDGSGYRLVFLPPLERFPSGDSEVDAKRINDALSALVSEAPEQYLWIQKRFLHGAEGQLDTYDHC